MEWSQDVEAVFWTEFHLDLNAIFIKVIFPLSDKVEQMGEYTVI